MLDSGELFDCLVVRISQRDKITSKLITLVMTTSCIIIGNVKFVNLKKLPTLSFSGA